MYGCYVLGRLWFFVVLDGSDFAQSRAFDSTEEDDIFAILAHLKTVKANIEAWFVKNDR